MIKHKIKRLVNKKNKIKFQYSQQEILNFLKGNIGTSIIIMLAILFIAIGNPFVIGAVIGGYLGAKKAEEMRKSFHEAPIIACTIVGAFLGGTMVIIPLGIGSFFGVKGAILGAVIGIIATVLLASSLTENVISTLVDFAVLSGSKKSKKKPSISKKVKFFKAKPITKQKYKKPKISKRSAGLRTA